MSTGKIERDEARRKVSDPIDVQLGQRLNEVYKLAGPPASITEFAELIRARNHARPALREFLERVRAGKAVIGECAEERGYSMALPDGRNVKVMCAYDALMSSILQGQGLVRAACPHCGEKTEIHVKGIKVASSSSPSIIFWWGTGPRDEPGNPVCDHLHLFPTREHLASWRGTRPNELGFSLSLAETLDLFAQFY